MSKNDIGRDVTLDLQMYEYHFIPATFNLVNLKKVKSRKSRTIST